MVLFKPKSEKNEERFCRFPILEKIIFFQFSSSFLGKNPQVIFMRAAIKNKQVPDNGLIGIFVNRHVSKDTEN